MARGQGGLIAGHFQRLFGRGTVAGLTEPQLLDEFLTRRDEIAFQALVARHGPMVRAVCRHLVHEEHDVEDAFQATFLILVRKAGSIRRRERLGPWLYGVAYRVALRARAQSARRRQRERTGAEVEEAAMRSNHVDDVGRLDQYPALHQELSRLPAKYRDPVVLCYLEGQTHDEAAAALCWPVGTVRGRLARARDLLRGRLARRGVTLSALLGAGALLDPVARAAVPEALAHSTVQAALRFAASPASAAGGVSITVFSLMEGVLKAMLFNKIRLVAAFGAALLLGLFATGAAVRGLQASAGPAQAKSPQTASVAASDAGASRSPASVSSDPLAVVAQAQTRAAASDGEGRDNVEAISDELDEARVEQEVLLIELQTERQRLSMELQQLKQHEFPYPNQQFFGGTSKDEAEKARKEAEAQRKETLEQLREQFELMRAQYLEDTKKLSRVKRRITALEKKLNVPPANAGGLSSLESRLTEVERKLDQLLKAVENKK